VFWLDDYEYEYEARVRNFYNHETWYVSMDERERERERERENLAAHFQLFRWDYVSTKVKNTGEKNAHSVWKQLVIIFRLDTNQAHLKMSRGIYPWIIYIKIHFYTLF
jgi:hypothetical protein